MSFLDQTIPTSFMLNLAQNTCSYGTNTPQGDVANVFITYITLEMEEAYYPGCTVEELVSTGALTYPSVDYVDLQAYMYVNFGPYVGFNSNVPTVSGSLWAELVDFELGTIAYFLGQASYNPVTGSLVIRFPSSLGLAIEAITDPALSSFSWAVGYDYNEDENLYSTLPVFNVRLVT